MSTTPDPSRFAVSLNLRSTLTTVDQISEIMAVSPTRTQVFGEPVSSRDPHSARHMENLWTLEGPNGSRLDEVLTNLLDIVGERPSRLPVDCTAEVWVMLVGRPMGNLLELGSELIERLARLRVPVVLDVYDGDDHA